MQEDKSGHLQQANVLFSCNSCEVVQVIPIDISLLTFLDSCRRQWLRESAARCPHGSSSQLVLPASLHVYGCTIRNQREEDMVACTVS